MKKIILTTIVGAILAGCATQPNPYNQRATTLTDQCNPLERDLTLQWQNRYYWCADNYYKQQAVDLQREIARQKAAEEREARIEARKLEKEQKRELRELQKLENQIVNSPNSYTETASFAFQEQSTIEPTIAPTITPKPTPVIEQKVEFSAPRSLPVKTPVDTTTDVVISEFIKQTPNAQLVKISGCQLTTETNGTGYKRASDAKVNLLKKGFKGSVLVEGGQCFSNQSIKIEEI